MPLAKKKSKNKAAEPHTQTASVESLNPNNTSVSNQQAIILNAIRRPQNYNRSEVSIRNYAASTESARA